MSFEAGKFMSTDLVARTEIFKVPQLADYFEESAEWLVRGLEAHEMAQVRVARFKRRNQLAALKALSSFTATDAARKQMLEELVNMGAEVEAEMAGRLEMLVIASVSPKITMEVAVKLSKTYPTVFWSLTDTISTLTDQGAVAGESTPSGMNNELG